MMVTTTTSMAMKRMMVMMIMEMMMVLNLSTRMMMTMMMLMMMMTMMMLMVILVLVVVLVMTRDKHLDDEDYDKIAMIVMRTARMMMMITTTMMACVNDVDIATTRKTTTRIAMTMRRRVLTKRSKAATIAPKTRYRGMNRIKAMPRAMISSLMRNYSFTIGKFPFFFAYCQKINTPEFFIVLFSPEKLALLSLLKEVEPSPDCKMLKLLTFGNLFSPLWFTPNRLPFHADTNSNPVNYQRRIQGEGWGDCNPPFGTFSNLSGYSWMMNNKA